MIMDLFIKSYDFIPNPKRTGRVIKEIMDKNNLKQSELAERLFIEVKTIGNWMIGRSFPELDTLVSIKNEFDVSLNDLLLPDSKPVVEKMELNSFYINIDSQSGNAKDIIEINRKDIMAFDYYIQKYFFSYLDSKDLFNLNGPFGEHTYFGKPVLEVFKEIEKNIELTFGNDYRIKIRNNDIDLKNMVSFEIMKYVRLGKINVNVLDVSRDNHLVLNQFEDAYDTFVEYDELCYFGNFIYTHLEYQNELINLLNPVEVDLVYNAMLLLNEDAFVDSCKLLREKGAKKLKFAFDFKVTRDDINDMVYRFGNLMFKILNVVKKMNYHEYLNERDESNEE